MADNKPPDKIAEITGVARDGRSPVMPTPLNEIISNRPFDPGDNIMSGRSPVFVPTTTGETPVIIPIKPNTPDEPKKP